MAIKVTEGLYMNEFLKNNPRIFYFVKPFIFEGLPGNIGASVLGNIISLVVKYIYLSHFLLGHAQTTQDAKIIETSIVLLQEFRHKS